MKMLGLKRNPELLGGFYVKTFGLKRNPDLLLGEKKSLDLVVPDSKNHPGLRRDL